MVKVLVLGALGFIGRNAATYASQQEDVEKVRAVDKKLLPTVPLGGEHKAAFDSDKIEVMQGNLSSAASIEKCFDGGFDYVIYAAGESMYGQTEEVYKEKVVDVAVKCGTEAAKQGVKKFVYVSTAQVYDESKKATSEDGKLKPWTLLAKSMLATEEALAAIEGLPLVVLRPVTVYGPGDETGLMPRAIVGAVYAHKGEKMQFMWEGKMKTNTVHSRDMSRALWHACTTIEAGKKFNVADKGDTDQEKIAKLLEQFFGIKTSFLGHLKSWAAWKMGAKTVTEFVNESHLPEWSAMCKESNIGNTPLTPYMDPELLQSNQLCADGSALENTGFKYEVPELTVEGLKELVEYYKAQNLFPEWAKK